MFYCCNWPNYKILQVVAGIQPLNPAARGRSSTANHRKAKQKLIGDSVSYSQNPFKVNEILVPSRELI